MAFYSGLLIGLIIGCGLGFILVSLFTLGGERAPSPQPATRAAGYYPGSLSDPRD